MKRIFLFAGCLLAAAVASAQTVTWNPDTWYLEGGKRNADGTGTLNAASVADSWVRGCDIDGYDGDVKALIPEFVFTHWGKSGGWGAKETSNIGTPLQLILNGSASVYKDSKFCSDSRRMELARRFLQMGANPDDGLYHQAGNRTETQDPEKTRFFKIDTPLGYAARTGRLDVAELLLKNGANPNYAWQGFWQKTESGASWDNNGHFALKEAVLAENSAYTFDQRRQMVRLLVRYGADVNQTDACGVTVLTRLLWCASGFSGSGCPDSFAHRDYEQLLGALRQQGADPNVKGQALKSCQSSVANVSAKDVLKEIKGLSFYDEWKKILK